jgi:CelD/BcsL family acetyltransferase involved in cellulose biosynthesis
MKVTIVPARDLTTDDYSHWRTIQLANPNLGSPYFCPEFTVLTANVRNDIYAGVMEESGRIVGFFPFQRPSRYHARPVGGTLSDYQGIIMPPTQTLSPEHLLEACGLTSWEFDHWITTQDFLSQYYKIVSTSPVIDLVGGFETYYSTQLQKSPKRLKALERERRKLIREVGPLRYESRAPDRQILQQLLNWKSQQLIRTGLIDIFSLAWIRELIERIHATQTAYFSGALSILYAGDEIVAAHMGMISHAVWHYWFPSYDHRFKRYSPGLLLLMEMAKDAASSGIPVLDLGEGTDLYKTYVSNRSIPIAQGCVVLPAQQHIRTLTRQLSGTAAQLIRRTPFIGPVSASRRLWRQYQAHQRLR